MSTNDEYFLTWTEFHQDTLQLASQLLEHYKGQLPWRGIIGIARGGLIPATILGRELNIRLIDSFCISSYDHDQQGDVSILKPIEGEGEGYLLVDDLVDTGRTARVATELLPSAEFISVYAKPAGRAMTEHFVREFPQTTWLHFPWDTDTCYREPLANTYALNNK